MAFLRDLLQTVSQPFRGTADLTLNAIGNLLYDMGAKEAGARVGTLLDETPFGLTRQEQQNVYSGDMLDLFKPAAGVASFAVPGAGAGGSVARAAGLGALAGGLGGFGASEQGTELESILTGGLTGGALGGGLQYGTNLLRDRSLQRLAGQSILPEGALLDEAIAKGGMTADTALATADDPLRQLTMETEALVRPGAVQEYGQEGLERLLNIEKGLERYQPGMGTGQVGLAKQAYFDDLQKLLQGGEEIATAADDVAKATGSKNVFQKVGAKLREPGLKVDPNDVGGVKALDEINEYLSGYKGSQSQKLQAMQKQYAKLNARLGDLTAKSSKTTNANNIMEAFEKALEFDSPASASSFADDMRNQIATLQDAGGNLTDSQLASLKVKAQSRLTNFYNRAARGQISDSAEEAVNKAIRDATDKAIKRNIPESSAILKEMSTINQANKGLSQVVNRGSRLGIPMAGGAASVDAQPFIGGVKDLAGRGLESVGNIGQSNVAQRLSGVAQRAAPIAQQAARVAPAVAGAMTAGTPEEVAPGTQAYIDELGALNQMLGVQGQPGASQQISIIDALAMAQQLQPYGSESENLKLAQLLMDEAGGQTGGGGVTTESGRKFQFAKNNAQSALATIQQFPDVGGKTQSIENFFKDIFGTADEATAYKQQLESLRSAVFNALGGTALSETEKRQYEKFVPKITDSAAQAQQKLSLLIPQLDALIQGADLPPAIAGMTNEEDALAELLGL